MTLPSADLTCAVCAAAGPGLALEVARVTSNVRAFARESFAVWRCGSCRSIHARDEVDLARYYEGYPFFSLPGDGRLELLYDEQLRRLECAGLTRRDGILDYGCGSGAFVAHLRRRGYARASGYDSYSPVFGDRSVLARRYDCVTSQDVLEHVPQPGALLDRFGELARPGGIIAIGTPNAEAVDLRRAEHYRHTLHLPYHRHILSKAALLGAAARRGWRLQHYYSTQYANTRIPFLNSRFYSLVMQALDGTLDALLEPPRLAPLLRRLPEALYWGLLGSYLAEETDIMAVFRSSST